MAKILIMEPDPGIRSLLKFVLQDAGHTTFLGDPYTANAKADVVIVDAATHNPEHVVDLSVLLRDRFAGTPVIFCTSFPDLGKLAQERRLFEAVIFKPFSVDELLEAVDSLLVSQLFG